MAPRDHRRTLVQRVRLATWRMRAVSAAARPGLSGLRARIHLWVRHWEALLHKRRRQHTRQGLRLPTPCRGFKALLEEEES
jgi:hypothetical protein